MKCNEMNTFWVWLECPNTFWIHYKCSTASLITHSEALIYVKNTMEQIWSKTACSVSSVTLMIYSESLQAQGQWSVMELTCFFSLFLHLSFHWYLSLSFSIFWHVSLKHTSFLFLFRPFILLKLCFNCIQQNLFSHFAWDQLKIYLFFL